MKPKSTGMLAKCANRRDTGQGMPFGAQRFEFHPRYRITDIAAHGSVPRVNGSSPLIFGGRCILFFFQNVSGNSKINPIFSLVFFIR